MHQFLWQVKRQRALLAVHAALWFILTWLVWTMPETAWTEAIYFHEHVALLGLTVILALETAGADPARGTDSFWRTRPPRWRTVCLAQVMFVIVALAGPALVCWLINGLMLDQTPAQWRAGLAEPVGIVSALLVLTGLRSLARGWTATVVALGVAGGVISAGAALLIYADVRLRDFPIILRYYGGTARGAFFMVACAVPAFAIVAVWAAGMRGRMPRWFTVSAIVWLIVGPALVWISVRGNFITHLQIAATVPGEFPAAGVKALGVVKLRGVPEDREVAILHEQLMVSGSKKREGIEAPYSPDIFLPWSQNRALSWLTTVTGQRIRDGFPAATRWYSDGTGEEGDRKFSFTYGAGKEPWPARLRGNVVGQFVAPAAGFALNLREGSAAAGHGTRLRIREVNAGSRNLEIVCDIWQARSTAYWSRQEDEGMFILHLPAVPAAVLIDERMRLSFRSLGCASSRIVLGLSMPDAEFVSGKRFTPDVLSGAELWHFGPGEESIFEARPEDKDVLLYPEMGR